MFIIVSFMIFSLIDENDCESWDHEQKQAYEVEPWQVIREGIISRLEVEV